MAKGESLTTSKENGKALSEMLQSYVDLKTAQQQNKLGHVPVSRAGPAGGPSPTTNRGFGT